MMRDTLAFKGLNQFDYITKDQSDELINNDELEEALLKLWQLLGLQ